MCEHLRDLREVVRTSDQSENTDRDLNYGRQVEPMRTPVSSSPETKFASWKVQTLVETLFLNPNMRSSSVDRMLDFAARNEMRLGEYSWLRRNVGRLHRSRPPIEDEAAQNDEIFRTLVDEAQRENQESQAAQTPTVAKSLPSPKKKNQRKGAAQRRSHSRAQCRPKGTSGMMGSPTERGILIKDTNKVVARTVIRSLL